MSIGTHQIELDPPVTCVVRLSGDVSALDVSRILDAVEGFAEGRARAYLLIDIAGVGHVLPEARRACSLRQFPRACAGLALFGGTFQQRVAAKLVTTAGWLLRGRAQGRPRPICLPDERAARAWVESMSRSGGAPRADQGPDLTDQQTG